ncbi:MAG: VCBS repeat-containing protein, partial [Planctomycetes bacterium]|nr:VCBS repeat-containing protein [Planctomycetota bacterium]
MLHKPHGGLCSLIGAALAFGLIIRPSSALADERSTIRFTDATRSSGIEFTMTSGWTPSRQLLEINGGGVALIDYDNDGDFDLFFANGATLDDPEHGPGSRLYANNGDGTFKDVTRQVEIEVTRWAMGVAVGDYNNDGCDDLYITCFGPNVLLRNECAGPGPKRFVDVSDEAQVADDRWGTSAAFADLDGDGDLDLYVVNYLEFDVDHLPVFGQRKFLGVPVMAGPAGLTPQGDVLYENLGDGTFRDITIQSGCAPEKPKYGLGVVVLDLDNNATQD